MARRETVVLIAMTLAFMAAAGAMGLYVLMQVLPGAPAGYDASDRLRRARANANMGDLQAAIDDLTAAIEERPDSIDRYVVRAETYDRLGDPARAIEDFTSALAIGPSFRAYTGRARVRLRTGDPAGAVEDLTGAIELSPDAAGLWLTRGRARRQLGEFDEAVVDVVQAWELAPGIGNIHNDVAWAQWGVDDYEGALRSFDRAVRAQPGFAHNVFGRGVTLYHLGRLDEAEKALEWAAGSVASGRVYAAFYLWLSRAAAARDPNGANAGLRDYLDGPGGSAVAPWPRRIADFLLGDITETQLLDDAATGTWQPAPEQLCEACYYAGAIRRIRGDEPGAVALFRRTIATARRNYYEYYSARAELRDLGGVPEQPADGVPE